jgi:hypothetical protein
LPNQAKANREQDNKKSLAILCHCLNARMVMPNADETGMCVERKRQLHYGRRADDGMHENLTVQYWKVRETSKNP